jgi:hypothetical protein
MWFLKNQLEVAAMFNSEIGNLTRAQNAMIETLKLLNPSFAGM